MFDLLEHPYFQRLRRISQTSLTYMVFPGALHTRFQHALGATHLMYKALDALKHKGVNITEEEQEAALIAIMLHDIGHGPFSHTLENSIVRFTHEEVSLGIMQKLNHDMGGALELAIKVFKNQYHKPFLHQLISSQLDVDRLDYLKRDSFYAGVAEGNVNSERLIEMLDIDADNQLVVDVKGVYSIEKFLVARRFMYWQVYLHKTVLAAEFLLVRILMRAKELIAEGHDLSLPVRLQVFLEKEIDKQAFLSDPDYLNHYTQLDDFDILYCVKNWSTSNFPILSELCQRLMSRNLLKIKLEPLPFDEAYVARMRDLVRQYFQYTSGEENYLVFSGTIGNNAYDLKKSAIILKHKDGSLQNLEDNQDILNIDKFTTEEKRYYLCFPEIKGVLESNFLIE